jgi:trehalose 6-phosphate phosphatase
VTHSPDQIMADLLNHDRVWLFLDYDGTLADFAPTPADVFTEPEVVGLVTRLTMCPCVRVAVISGRALSQIQQLLPAPNVLLAGTYGVELQTFDGKIVHRAERSVIRPALEQLKPIWQQLIAARTGFFIEDKGWALALHARFANAREADQVLADAGRSTLRLALSGEFRVLQGEHFLEVAPAIAHKGHTVDYLLDRFAWPGALPVYLGDDDKDEDAFAAIKAHQGVALVVAAIQRPTQADAQLASPQAARAWLNQLAEHLGAQEVT